MKWTDLRYAFDMSKTNYIIKSLKNFITNLVVNYFLLF